MNSKEIKPGRRIFPFCLLLCSAILLLDPSAARSLPRSGSVKAVFDGDTILLDSGDRVRYLGIDAPEVAHEGTPADCYGDEARETNRRWVLHQQVTLQYDRETRDQYGRLLAYVYLADGTCINAALLRAGLAWVFRFGEGFGKFQEFLGYQREALHQRNGLWGSCPVHEEPDYVGNHRSWIFHRPSCPMGKRIPRRNLDRPHTRRAALESGYRPCRICKP
jgi:micrococcal nuclease